MPTILSGGGPLENVADRRDLENVIVHFFQNVFGPRKCNITFSRSPPKQGWNLPKCNLLFWKNVSYMFEGYLRLQRGMWGPQCAAICSPKNSSEPTPLWYLTEVYPVDKSFETLNKPMSKSI